MVPADWITIMFGADADVAQLDTSGWRPWRADLADVLLALDDGALVTIIAPPLDRAFPTRPAESRWTRLRGRGRFWPSNPEANRRRAGFDERLAPRVQVFRHGQVLSAQTPSSVDELGWFPWTAPEFAQLLAAGWSPAADVPFENPDDLHWYGPRDASADRDAFLSADPAERDRIAAEICDLTVALLEGVVGLTDPTAVHVVRQR